MHMQKSEKVRDSEWEKEERGEGRGGEERGGKRGREAEDCQTRRDGGILTSAHTL